VSTPLNYYSAPQLCARSREIHSERREELEEEEVRRKMDFVPSDASNLAFTATS